MTTRGELVAWAAGLFEGEGSFNVYRRGSTGKLQPQARLAMADEDVVRRFRDVVQMGSVRRREPPAKFPHYKPMFEWSIQNAPEVEKFCRLMLPWLGNRRRARALDVLAAAADIGPHGGDKTHCPQGHPYEGENLRIEISKSGQRRRVCRECDNRRARERARRRNGVTPDRYRM